MRDARCRCVSRLPERWLQDSLKKRKPPGLSQLSILSTTDLSSSSLRYISSQLEKMKSKLQRTVVGHVNVWVFLLDYISLHLGSGSRSISKEIINPIPIQVLFTRKNDFVWLIKYTIKTLYFAKKCSITLQSTAAFTKCFMNSFHMWLTDALLLLTDLLLQCRSGITGPCNGWNEKKQVPFSELLKEESFSLFSHRELVYKVYLLDYHQDKNPICYQIQAKTSHQYIFMCGQHLAAPYYFGNISSLNVKNLVR